MTIKEMQIKTTLRFYLIPVRIASIKDTIKDTTNNNKHWQQFGTNGTFIHCLWECMLVQPLWKTIWRLLNKVNIDLPYDPAIPLLGICLKEFDSVYYKEPAHSCLLQHYLQ
jgi:hypothetical protein